MFVGLAGSLTLAALAPSDATAARCDGKKATIKGTDASETLKGTRRADVIVAKSGDDTVKGRGKADRICGGDGDDTLRGESGNDKLFGQAGDDLLDDDAGTNLLDGGEGSDECLGGPGDQLLDCEAQLYVSALAGSDANPGTRAAPLATIGQAITNAVALGGPVDVIVGGGSYAEDVTLSEGVSLLGGHDCPTLPCSWNRDPSAHPSLIVNQDFDGVIAPMGVTRATRLDGFTIDGQDGTPATLGSALTLAGTPRVTGNRILGGDVTAGRTSYGIAAFTPVAAPGALVQGNEVLAGDSPTLASWGVIAASALELDSNLINADQANAGTCASTTLTCGGVFSSSSSATITNNVIFGLPAPQSTAILLGELEAPVQTLRLNANYLDGAGVGLAASPTASAAILLRNAGCAPCGFNGTVGRIRNNLLLGGLNQSRFGIREDPSSGRTIRPELLENNNFFFSALSGRTDAMYRTKDAAGVVTDYNSPAAINTLTTPPAANNFSADCLFDSTFHLPAGASQCRDAGTATEAPDHDRDGDPRPRDAAVDVGPDETG